MAVSTAPAAAVTYPYKLHQEQNIDTHQVGWIDLTIDPQGHGSLTDSWSNGKQSSGNIFYAIVVLVTKDGHVVWSNKQTKGIDGSFGGHAREGHVPLSFALDQDQMAMFDHVTLKIGVTQCGMELADFKCCDNGVEATFSTRKCDVPAVPRTGIRHQTR